MPKKLKITPPPTLLPAGTPGADFIQGANDSLNPDTIDAGAGDDIIKSYQGADTISGGTGADKYIVDWPDSNVVLGQDKILDFKPSEGDHVDLSFVSRYSDANMAIATSRKVNASDLTLTPIPGGTHAHVEVVAGNPTWDIDIDLMSDEVIDVTAFRFG